MTLRLAQLALITFSSLTYAQLENFDYQTPAEVEAARREILKEFGEYPEPKNLSRKARLEILSGYSHLDPRNEVPGKHLREAILFFDHNRSHFPNTNFISIFEISARSDYSRFYVIDMFSGVVHKYHTTHGIGSDPNNDGLATLFGNVPGSQKSSLGFIRTGAVYFGKFQRSMFLDGLSTTNSKIRERAIVFHGWDGVSENNIIQSRSAGCITIDWRYKDAIIDKIRDGSLIYVGK